MAVYFGAGKETLELLAQPGGWIQELGSWLLFLGRPGARAAYSYHEKTSHKDWTFRGAGNETLTRGLILGKDAL